MNYTNKYLEGDDQMAGQASARESGVSRLRILATACVVWLHTCTTLIDNPDVFSITQSQHIFFSSGGVYNVLGSTCVFYDNGLSSA